MARVTMLRRIAWPLLMLLLLALGFLPAGAGEKDKKGGDKDKGNAPEIVTTIKGHSELVYAVDFSKDGNYLLTASFDKTLKLWDAKTGKEIKTFGGPGGHQKSVLTAAFSPDGLTIASGGQDNTVKVWDVPSSSPLRSLTEKDAVNALALSPDGTKLATAGKDGAVKLWNAGDFKQPLFTLTGHAGPVTGVSFSGNGQMLASSGADKTVRFWNVANGQPIATVGAHTAAVNAVLINPNNTAAYSVGDDGLLKFWTVPPAPARALAAHGGSVTSLALSADGATLVSGGADKTVRLTQIAGGKEVRALTGATAAITSVGLTSKGDLIAAGTADNRLVFWGADAKPKAQFLAHQGPVTGLSVHPQNPQVLTGGGDGLIKLWAAPAATRLLTHSEPVLSAAISADGKRLFTGSADKVLLSWDTAKNVVERKYVGHTGPVTAIAASANGQILVSGSTDGTLRLWNQMTGKENEIVGAHDGAVTSLALNAAATQMASTSEDGTVKIWQLPLVAARPFVHPDQVTCLTVSADGAKLVTGCGDKQARLWDMAKGVKEKDFTGQTQPLSAVAINGAGTLVAGGGADKSFSVWNVGDAKPIKKLDNLPAAVNALAFAADAKVVAVGLGDNTIRLYDFAGGKDLKTLGTAGKDSVSALAYLPKGDQILAGSTDKTIQLWSPADGASKNKWEHTGAVTCLAVRKDGSAFAAAAGNTVKAWSVGDGKELASFDTPAEVKGVAFAPDGSKLVVSGTDNRARVYGLDGKMHEFFMHDGPVLAASFVDAKRVVTASADKTARLWTSALVWQKRHAGPVRQVLFTPKGDRLYTASDDKTIKTWSAADGKELKSIAAHDGAVTRLALTGDGTRLISAGADKTVKVWNLAAAKDKADAEFKLAGAPESLALSGNGQRIAVAVAEKDGHPIRIFDAAKGREIFAIADHAGAVHALAFLGERTVLSASADKTVRFSDVPLLSLFDGHAGGVSEVHFNANGAQALSAGADKTVKIWDLAKGAALKTFGPFTDPLKAVTWSKDNAIIAAAAGKTVKFWNAGDGKDLATITLATDVRSLSLSPDKSKLAVGGADKITRVFAIPGGKELQFFAQDDEVAAVVFDAKSNAVFSAAGKAPRLDALAIARVLPASKGALQALALTPTHVLTGGADKQVKFWNLQNGANDRSLPPAPEPIRAIALSKNNLLIAVAGDQAVRVYSAADGKELRSVKVGGAVRHLAFSPNSAILAGACADKSLLTWSTPFAAGQPLSPDFLEPVQSFAHAEAVTDIVFAADNATLFSSGADKTVHAWRLASPAPTRNFPHPNIVDAVAFHPTLPQLASGGHDGKIRIFDLTKGTQIREINAHPKPPNDAMIYTLVYSGDGKLLVSGSKDGSLKMWDEAGKLIKEFKAYKAKEFERGHRDPVFAAALSPDGKFLASGAGGLERVIKIWNVADGTVVRDLINPGLKSKESHPGWIYALRYTKDGKLISVGNAPPTKGETREKGYLAVWDPADGKLLYGEALPMGTFFSVAISPDQQRLALGAGPRGRPMPDFPCAFVVKMPVK